MFSYRTRRDGTVAIFWNNRPATVLAGRLAERFLEEAPRASDEERQLLMRRASGEFMRNERRRRERR